MVSSRACEGRIPKAWELSSPLEITEWKWEEVATYFIVRLLRTRKRHDTIWIITDRLTHFLVIRIKVSLESLVDLYISEIVRHPEYSVK